MIEALARPAAPSDIDELARLLVDAVDSGASVSFLAPLSFARAQEWWRSITATSDARALFLVFRDRQGIAGTVQVHPAWAENQPHRAEIAKLLVHRRSRRRGVGRALMNEAERRARESGFTLLTLDTKREDAAEALYRASGWTSVGVIPGYAFDAEGKSWDTVIFYKRLDPSPTAQII